MGLDVALDLPGPKAGPAAAAETLLDRLRRGGGIQLFGGAVASSAPGGPDGSAEPPPGPSERAPPPGFAQLLPAEQEAWMAPFRAVVDAIAAMPDAEAADVATLKVLAAMGRAYYSPDNAGHFGLASTHYNHFTSPIRRYPDLVVHRQLKWLLSGRAGPEPHSQQSLRTLCDHRSAQERAADALERRIKASCLVLASVAEGTKTASARVTGITPASLFVLRGDGIEARIPTRELPGAPFQADEWESMLFQVRRDEEPPDAGSLSAWLDPESGELRRVRARLADRVTVALAGRDVAAGRTGARLVAWG
jgi:ribonuclease R